MAAPIPADERQRLQALRRYGILDTPAEAAFERVTRLVAKLLKVPMATVTFIDENRQWFKSSVGVQGSETSRDLSFCAHAILDTRMTVVADAKKDERFRDNALVTGEPHICFYAGVPLASEDGYMLGTLCAMDTVPRQLNDDERAILADLAEIVKDELRLRLSVRETSQQAVAISQVKSGVVVTDPQLPDNPIVFANPYLPSMTGYSQEEIIGRNCRFLQGPATDPKTVQEIREAIEDRRTFQGEILNYRKDGTSFWNDLTISPVFDKEGELISYIGIQTDTTERRRIADQLRESYERLKELEGQRDNLTHMIVHDLRSPLTSVIGFLDLLKATAGGKFDSEESRFIDIACLSAGKLQEMITSLLDVNKLEAGEMPLNRQPSDLRDVITSATNPFLPAMEGRSFIRELPEEPINVSCDADLIERVIANLVSNAIKFTPETGEIRATIIPDGRLVRVAVADTGPGIPEEYHARIFEKFGQIGARRYRHSTGLGLAFCKLAVEAHGGEIGLESRDGRGTTFWFSLERA